MMARAAPATHWIDEVYTNPKYGYASSRPEDRDPAEVEWDRGLDRTAVAGLRSQLLESVALVNATPCDSEGWAGYRRDTEAAMRGWPGTVLRFADGEPRGRVGLDGDVLARLPEQTLKRAYALADVALRNGAPSLPDLKFVESEKPKKD